MNTWQHARIRRGALVPSLSRRWIEPDKTEPRGRYGAFISYKRTVDVVLATALEGALERFAKPWNRLRAVRVFRDDADLSTNAGLWTSITEALGESDVLILLASQPAVESAGVAREVKYWQHKDIDRLLAVEASTAAADRRLRASSGLRLRKEASTLLRTRVSRACRRRGRRSRPARTHRQGSPRRLAYGS